MKELLEKINIFVVIRAVRSTTGKLNFCNKIHFIHSETIFFFSKTFHSSFGKYFIVLSLNIL